MIEILFGTATAVSFAGMERTRKNYIAVGCLTTVLFFLQVICLNAWDIDVTFKLYPLLSHLPITVFIVAYLKRPWLISLTSVLASFLCCQPPRWIGTALGEVFDSVSINHVSYIAAAFLTYCFLRKYAVTSVRHLIERSVSSCLLLAPCRLFTICSNMLDSQFKQAQKEFESLRQMQKTTASYRHDMRHHFALLQSMASKGNMEDIKEYLQTVQSDLDAITPVRFCENETVNLILSSFAAKAKQSEVRLTIDAKLPDSYPFSDTELCSLLSNTLENAIHASKQITDISKRIIHLRMFSRNNKLCIDIRNSYQKEPVFHHGLPVSKEQGHGFGTKSMAHIVEKYGGVF